METWEDTLTMSRKEVPRAGLVKAALAGQITNAQGATALRLSIRQFQRLKRRFEQAGPRGLLHAGRGRPSPRALPPELRTRVADLLQTRYRDVNDCHVTEKLREVEGLPIGRERVRQIRRALGLPPKHRRRPRRHRARRTPAAQLGALVLVDGSDHDWLEGRGPRMTLLGMLDDATGDPLALHFRPEEDLHGYLTLLAQLAAQHGLPLAFYGDRLNVFVRNDAHWSLEEQLQGAQHPTQFGRILRDLGIGYIAARSPQAKGRIENLWGTLQDRLVVELRLRAIATRAAANAFLPTFVVDYARRFGRAPADAGPAWRRPPARLADLLSCRHQRTVARDNTLRLGPRWVQIPPGPAGRSYAGCRVEVRECLDGRLLVSYHDALIATAPSPGPDFVLHPRPEPHAPSNRRRPAAPSPATAAGRRLRLPQPQPPAPSHARRAAQLPPAPTHPWRQSYNPRRPGTRGMTLSRGN
jgi:transposase